MSTAWNDPDWDYLGGDYDKPDPPDDLCSQCGDAVGSTPCDCNAPSQPQRREPCPSCGGVGCAPCAWEGDVLVVPT